MVAQRDREGKNALVGELGVLCWLLKDAFWVVLCPYVCIPAALSAISIETYYLFQSWPTLSRHQQMHTLAVLLWLMGNFTWMCGELLFAPSEGAGRHFPWFHGPLVAASEEINGYFVAVARVIFTTGILTCASCYPRYVRSLCRRSRSEPDEVKDGDIQPLHPDEVKEVDNSHKVFGVIEPEVYGMFFMGPWIVKDLFWTYSNVHGALGCSAIVAALICDSLRRVWDLRNVAELIWVSGNTVWVVGELVFDDSLRRVRVLACLILLSGCLPLAEAITAEMRGGKQQDLKRQTSGTFLSTPLGQQLLMRETSGALPRLIEESSGSLLREPLMPVAESSRSLDTPISP